MRIQQHRRRRAIRFSVIFSLGLFFSLNFFADAKTADFYRVRRLHHSWTSAFEQADIDRASQIWAHTDDVKLINLFDETRDGWKKVHAELFLLFERVGKTQMNISNLMIAVVDDEASVTLDYRWSLIPKVELHATEMYRKIDGQWKLVFNDATGESPSLRPLIEDPIRNQLLLIETALETKTALSLAEKVSDDFLFTSFDGVPHPRFDLKALDRQLAEVGQSKREVVFFSETIAKSFFIVERNLGQRTRIRFTHVPPAWHLKRIDFHTDENPRSVARRPRLVTTTWAVLKMRRIERH